MLEHQGGDPLCVEWTVDEQPYGRRGVVAWHGVLPDDVGSRRFSPCIDTFCRLNARFKVVWCSGGP